MIVSAIVVSGRPEHGDAIRESIAGLPWAEVHYGDESGRFVVGIEAADVEQSIDRVKELRSLPRVLQADLAQYGMVGDENREREPHRRQP